MFPPIPENTVRAARAIYGKGNLYLRLGDHLNRLISKFDQENPVLKQEGSAAIQLGLITIIQFMEELTDMEVTDSIQRRHDLKYALHLDIINPRIYPSLLCVFRHRILSNAQYREFFAEMLAQIAPEIGLEACSGQSDVEHLLNSICQNTVRKTILNAMFHTIEALSADHFNWLRKIAPPHWYERYSRSAEMRYGGANQRLEIDLKDVGRDIEHMLREIRQSDSRELAEMPEIKTLRFIIEHLPMWESTSICNHCINQIF